MALIRTLTLPCRIVTYKPMIGRTGHVIAKSCKSIHHKTRQMPKGTFKRKEAKHKLKIKFKQIT